MIMMMICFRHRYVKGTSNIKHDDDGDDDDNGDDDDRSFFHKSMKETSSVNYHVDRCFLHDSVRALRLW